MKITKKNTRLYDIMQAVILFGFGLYFIGVVVSGSVYRYVHERQVPVLLFSAAVFLLLGMLKLRQGNVLSLSVFSGSRTASGFFSLAVFAAALIGMLIMSGTPVRFSQFAYTDSIGGQSSSPSGTAESQAVSSSGAALPSVTASPTGVSSGVSPPVEREIQAFDSDIVMDSDSFAQWLTELYTKPDAWVGKKITASGSVWKDGELFEKDEFALARMMMTCCAADMQPVGVLAQWSGVQALIDGEWVEVTGTLSKKPYKGSFDPLIIVETIKKIDPPQREYIYP